MKINVCDIDAPNKSIINIIIRQFDPIINIIY